MKKEILVLGAGTGGMPAAYELQAALGNKVHVTVVNQSEYFQFVPSNPWVAVGWRTRKDTTFSIRPHLEKRGSILLSGKWRRSSREGTMSFCPADRCCPMTTS